MALSVVDLYRKILPRTNCGECGFSTCLAFASMVVSEKLPLRNCPYIEPETLAAAEKELEEQYKAGKWTKKDMAADALQWAKQRAASMAIVDLPERIGGRLVKVEGKEALELSYFQDTILIRSDGITKKSGESLNWWEQTFIYNHMAMGGRRMPTGTWKGLVELPNTVSKVKSMKAHVENPLIQRFQGNTEALQQAALDIGGEDMRNAMPAANVAMLFHPLPRIPVMLTFWDEEPQEGYGAEAKLLFDETIVEHLDIESIMFLSERIKELLCGDSG
jgi:hypothetical protein